MRATSRRSWFTEPWRRTQRAMAAALARYEPWRGPASSATGSWSMGRTASRAASTASRKASGSATVTVAAGCLITPSGSIAGTGRSNVTHTPRAAVVANVIPRSPSDRWAGPATFHHVYGPVIVASTMFDGDVDNDHRPNDTVS